MNPTSDAIRTQLDRLCASSAFANSHRLNRFLRFVVERALAGDSDRLKEYVIGIEVFDRDASYDPRVDSIVRVEAGRLRSKLDAYYHNGGRLDPVVIRMQRGSYTPAFAGREPDAQPQAASAPPAPPALAPLHARSLRGVLPGSLAFALFAAVSLAWYLWQPAARDATIAVLPFDVYSTNDELQMLATQITDGVSAELVMNGALGVASSASARELVGSGRTLSDIAAALRADFLLQGRLRVDGRQVNVEAVLIVGAADRKAWVAGFTGDSAGLDELERRIAAAAVEATRRVDLR